MELSRGERLVMKRLRTSFLGFVGLVLIASSGCSLCCSPYTDDYVTFGSRTPRVDRKHGRVGSIFSDPQSMGNQSVISPSGEPEGIPYDGDFDETIDNGVISLGTKAH